MNGETTLRAIAKHMLEPVPGTSGLSKLATIALHLDKTDAELGIVGETEMQDDLRAWESGLRDALGETP